jgi:alanine racemase
VRSAKTQAVINLRSLAHNFDAVRRKTQGKTAIIAVVKANAYGHGLTKVAAALEKQGAAFLAVAYLNEALRLRQNGVKAPILVLFEFDRPDLFISNHITPMIYAYKDASAFSKEAEKRGVTAPIHVDIDTGMGRVGLRVENAFPEIIKIAQLSHIQVQGMMTHFSDADLADKEVSQKQLNSFLSVNDKLKTYGVSLTYAHVANSAAVLDFPHACLNAVRPGIMLYGYSATGDHEDLLPVLSLTSRVLYLKKVPTGTPISYGRTFYTKRESLIATIPIGYADGYNRLLSNCGQVIIHGKRAPIAGRVCMDLIMVDVTEIDHVSEGDEVILLGKQGNEAITAAELAEKTKTIPYEILTSISQDAARVYVFDK